MGSGLGPGSDPRGPPTALPARPPTPQRRWTRASWLLEERRRSCVTVLLVFCIQPATCLLGCQQAGTPGEAFDSVTCGVLQQLYNATGGDAWSPLVWGQQLLRLPVSYCSLPGLTCDSSGHALRLELPSNNLVGTLPPALTLLTRLEVLNVAHNFVFGTMPALGGGAALHTLDVSNNYFTGSLPASAANITTLALASNLLNATAPVPGSLCAQACSLTAWPGAFVCGLGNASASCSTSCSAVPCKPACPLARLTAADAARIAASCQSTAFACTTCLTNALVPFAAAGVPLDDSPMLGECLYEHAGQMLSAGALPTVVRAWESCSSSAAVPADVSLCPGALPVSAFAGATAPCSSPDLACTTCAAAVIQPYILAGWINASNYQAGFSTAAYAVAAACTVRHAAALVAVNISLIQLAVVERCWQTVHAGEGSNAAAANTTATASSTTSVRLATGLGVGLGGGGGLLLLLAAAALWLRTQLPRPPRGDVEAPAQDGAGKVEGAVGGGHPTVLLKAEDIRLFEVLGVGSQGSVVRAEWMGTPVSAKCFSIKLLPEETASWIASAPSLLEAASRPSSAWATGSHSDGGAVAVSLPLPPPQPFAAGDAMLLRGMEASSTLTRELEVLRELRHPNICAFYGLVLAPPCLVMELAARGSLHTFLRKPTHPPLLWPGRLAIGAGVAGGVQYLHSRSPAVVHADLKSANVVLSSDLVPKLCDFGISAFLPHPSPHQPGKQHALVGTPAFMAPEVALTLPVASPLAVDIYGVGVILHDLAHAGAPGARPLPDEWAGMAPMQILVARHQANFMRPVGAHVPPQLAVLIDACLAVEPAGRPTAEVLRAQLSELRVSMAKEC